MQFHTILTHESPDLDAILCCYLLHYYGERRYPGISQAKLEFCPAGCLPGEKTSEQLEQEGIIAVDIGGGRLDTHPDGNLQQIDKLNLSAANLVAVELTVDDRPSLKNLLEFVRVQDSTGKSLSSRNPVDHLVSLPNLVRGGLLHFGRNYAEMVYFFMDLIRAIETANEHPDAVSERNDNAHFVAEDKDCLFVSPELNFKSLFVAYLGQKFFKKRIFWQNESEALWQGMMSVLQTWDLHERPELQKLIDFFQRLKPDGYLLDSNTVLDRTVSLPYIVEGLYLLYSEFTDFVDRVFRLFDCILAYENSWQSAIIEYRANRRFYKINKIKLVAIEAERGAVVKVARWQDKADIVIFKDAKESHISISLNKLGRIRNYTFPRLAAKMRATELIIGNLPQKNQADELFDVGEIDGWFLHQSQKLLLHGSPKAYRSASAIPFDMIIQMVISELDTHSKLPELLCPPDHCAHHQCVFYALRLPNCFAHRQNLRTDRNNFPGDRIEDIPEK